MAHAFRAGNGMAPAKPGGVMYFAKMKAFQRQRVCLPIDWPIFRHFSVAAIFWSC
jgi:hypothetical protein